MKQLFDVPGPILSLVMLYIRISLFLLLQDDIVTGFHNSVSERFVPGCTALIPGVELIREGLVV